MIECNVKHCLKYLKYVTIQNKFNKTITTVKIKQITIITTQTTNKYCVSCIISYQTHRGDEYVNYTIRTKATVRMLPGWQSWHKWCQHRECTCQVRRRTCCIDNNYHHACSYENNNRNNTYETTWLSSQYCQWIMQPLETQNKNNYVLLCTSTPNAQINATNVQIIDKWCAHNSWQFTTFTNVQQIIKLHLLPYGLWLKRS